MSFEQPLLWVGMAGFSREQRAQLNLWLGQLPKGSPLWCSDAFADSDVWLFNGEKSRLLSAKTLKILAGQPTERAMQLDLGEVDRPIAFSLPLASCDLDPMYTFELGSSEGLRKVLQQFEALLRPLRSQFVLGGQLIERESQLLPGIYHVSHKGTLLAVMDFHDWRIGIAPDADPADFAESRWERRPRQAHDIPTHFLQSSLTQLRWIYAQRTKRDVLPPRYRSRPVYFRRAPSVPMRWLKDSQLVLLRELSVEAGSFEALQQRTGLTQARLARDLASLYYAGSVTTTAEKAGSAGFSGRGEGPASTAPNSLAQGISTDPESALARRPPSPLAMDLTAPVQLGLR